ncbi:hypothetical protein BDW72DRAFT_194649 [Aspergillus terricola var. indicus]
MRVSTVAIFALAIQHVRAQQPTGSQMFVDYPGLSDACKNALATNVTCTPMLPAISSSNFDSLTSSCRATGYSYTVSTTYALNSTTSITSATATSTTSDTPAQTCVGYYTVQSDDDCNSVAKAHSVSTYSLMKANNLDLYCQNFASVVATTLCIPPPCDTYTWHAWDDCNSVAANYSGVTLPQFLAWNPMFNALCLNAPIFDGYEICVSPPGGYLNHTTGANSNQTSTGGGEITTVAPLPTNALSESNHKCGLWYMVVKGDTCAGVSLAQSISLDDFYFLNPEIDVNCTNLQLDVAYCVQPVVNNAIPTATNDPGYIYTSAPMMPTAPGTIPDCYRYANADNYTTLCRYILGSYGISFEQLLDWNPSLDTDKYSCTLSLGNSYCVLQYENSTDPETSERTTSNCWPINATESSTVSNCNCFGIVDGLGAPSDFACKDFMSNFNITKADLINWNPWLATGDCNAALYSDLSETATRAVCIGTGTVITTLPADTASVTATRTTATRAPTQTDTASGFGKTCTNLWLGYAYCVEGPPGAGSATATATSTSSLNPTQTGIATDCNRYHNVAEGDSCAQVEENFGLTFA